MLILICNVSHGLVSALCLLEEKLTSDNGNSQHPLLRVTTVFQQCLSVMRIGTRVTATFRVQSLRILRQPQQSISLEVNAESENISLSSRTIEIDFLAKYGIMVGVAFLFNIHSVWFCYY